jgi:hypothetical protein
MSELRVGVQIGGHAGFELNRKEEDPVAAEVWHGTPGLAGSRRGRVRAAPDGKEEDENRQAESGSGCHHRTPFFPHFS